MRIPGIERLFSIVNAKFRKADGDARASAPRSQSPDRVEISGEGQRALAAKLATSSPADRAKQVAEIKAAYKRGELKTDENAIAREIEKHGYFDDVAGG